MYCNNFQTAYVRGELDTFKRAACLLVAINKSKITQNKELNAKVSLDSAFKMCEKPYWYKGEYADIPFELEEVDFKKAFENDNYVYTETREMLIKSLIYEGNFPLNYEDNLKLIYERALLLKHKLENETEDRKLKK